MSELKKLILEVLSECQPCSFEDLLSHISVKGDLRPLRRALAELIREGVVVKVPDYERRKLMYMLKS
ncbi:MAG: hypothetical protein F7C81_03950 [Desulfurococcales archaeon]|nr:hypothetical protein [Desulfurococcales archaeon]MEB3779982.1 hypothetical protein [Desulfurococcales archaeon]